MIWIFLFKSSISFKLINCSDARPFQMLCEPNHNCALNEPVNLRCVVFHSTICTGPRIFIKRNVSCRYCYQLPETEIYCSPLRDCTQSLSILQTRCYPLNYCMGPSIFEKNGKCMRSDKSQKTAFLLSLFLGGVGADRFYLGYYVTAVFKMLTFGGFGIAYLVDLLLILFGYLGPSGGSIYPERL